MYLKGIELQGFKSFADKINLEFGQGITTVVGPNGSGKSNISDAIRWVMGEQSAKSLRGGKMEDVIFAGTQKRSPLGYAQVSITLDNKDKVFKIDYDTIKVTRRVHRSGESNYLINDKECRLKDVHELFMDTGLGKEGYSVIGQGKIDQILSNKAEERRIIFEEASGITKYKYHKVESEKKLLKTEENLVRINDLLQELSSQVGPLENQSKKAKKYLELRESLKGLDINISIRNIDKQKEALKEGKEKFSIAFTQLNQEKVLLANIESQIEKETNNLTILNDLITSLRQKSFDIEKDKGELKNKIDLLNNNIENNLKNIERIDEEINLVTQSIKDGQSETQELLIKISQKEEESKKAQDQLVGSEKELLSIDDEISQKLEESEKLKNDIINLVNENSSLKSKISGLDALCKNFDDRKNSLTSDLLVKNESLTSSQREKDTLTKEKDETQKEKDALKGELEKLKEEYFNVTDLLNKAKEEQNEVVAKCNDKMARKAVLEDLEKGYEGYSKSVKAIIQGDFKGVCGVVSKLIEVDDKYVTAIEVALGGALQNIVVDNEDVAKKCISYLKENKIGRQTFLPLTSVKEKQFKNEAQNDKGYIDIASNLISHDKKYDNIFKNLLGTTVVVENIDLGVQMAKKYGYRFKIVTLDGQVLNPGGSITGGSVNKTQSLLTRAKDIEKLDLEIKKLSFVIDDNDEKINSFKTKINKMATKKDELDQKTSLCNEKLIKITSSLDNNSRIIKELERNIALITNESGNVVGEINEVQKQIENAKNTIISNEEKVKLIREELSKLETQGSDLTIKREELFNKITNTKILVADIKKDIELSNERISFIDSQKQLFAVSSIEKANQKDEFLAANEEIKKEISSINLEITNALSSNENLSDEIEKKSEEYKKTSERLIESQKSLKDKNESIYVLQIETSRIENQNAKLEMETEHIISKLWEEYELTYNAALGYKKEPFDMSSSQREAQSLRNEIKSLGNINIDSIEQYKEVKERFDFLSEQKLDLDQTKKKLEDIILDMQKVMIKQFNESFETIKEAFSMVFKALFGGGSARLSLTDPDNVLESGIEIEVQPPGKKLQNMMALSGGERALSAIALLFSVLEVRPTPFCILDEVEAALDDNNVYRFADYIKKYSKKTQFIVVTHRRGTMESADIMYGVTMQEKGVSKLLKLKFEDLEEYN